MSVKQSFGLIFKFCHSWVQRGAFSRLLGSSHTLFLLSCAVLSGIPLQTIQAADWPATPVSPVPDSLAGAVASLSAAIIAYAADPSSANADTLAAAQATYNSIASTVRSGNPGADLTIDGAATESITSPLNLVGAAAFVQVIDTAALIIEGVASIAKISDGAVLDIRAGNDASINFLNNQVLGDGAAGGAINAGGSMLYLENVIFNANEAFDNTLPPPSSSRGKGGAIYNSEGTLVIGGTKSQFIANSADAGGGIYNNQGVLLVSNATFQGNLSTTQGSTSCGFGCGGAIYNAEGSVVINHSNFSENESYYSGGAIYHAGGALSSMTITGGAFTNNRILNTGSGGTGGGAIRSNFGGTVNIDSVVFSGNSGRNGGAVYSTGTTTTITASTFDDNSAAMSGGAVNNDGAGSIANITQSHFTNNNANEGGAISSNNSGTSTTVINSTFTGNSANKSNADVANARGGAVYNVNAAVFKAIGSTQFTLNQANLRRSSNVGGGAIMNTGVGSTVLISESTLFDQNKVNVTNLINSNMLNSGGGAIFNNNGTMNIADSFFTQNTVFLNPNSTSFTLTSSGGGAIYNHGGTAMTTIAHTSFSENTVTNVSTSSANNRTAGGGAIFNNGGGTLDITDSSFSNNAVQVTADTSINPVSGGGAIYNLSVSNALIIKNTSFSENTVANISGDLAAGGAIFNNMAALTLTDAQFIKNSVNAVTNAYGGAIYLLDITQLALNVTGGHTSIFTGNTANTDASSIYMRATGDNTSLMNVTIEDNGLLDMRDPMGGDTTAVFSINQINKTQNGVWALGGANLFIQNSGNGYTKFNINDGRLYLYGDGEVTNGSSVNPAAQVAAGTLQLNGLSSTFTLGSGASLVAGGANTLNLPDGTITFSGGSTIRGGSASVLLGGEDSNRHESGGTTSLTVSGAANLEDQVHLAALDSTDTFTLNGTFGGVGGFTKSGLGVVVLTGNSTYTGGTIINEGILSVSADANMGNTTGAVTLNGGTLRNTAVFSTGRPFILGAAGGTFDTQADLTVSGVIEGSGALTKTNAGTLALAGGSNSWTGGTVLTDGILFAGVAGALVDNTTYTVNGGTLNLNDHSLIMSSLQGTGGIVHSGTQVATTLTVNEGNYAGVIEGNGSLVKTTAGTLILTGENTYTGETQVSAGELQVNGSIVNSNVNVAFGATLSGGNGAVLGNNVAVLGTLVGSQGSTLGMNSLVLDENSTLAITLDTPGNNPLFNITQGVTLGGSLSLTPGPGFEAGVYRIMNYGSPLVDNGLTTGNPDWYIQTSIANQVNLVNTSGVTLNFWDGATNHNNGHVDGGNGIWNLSNENWTNATGTLNAPYKPEGAFAVFMGMPGIVTVDNSDGQVDASGMQFAVGGYLIEGAALNLSGATIRVGDGTTAGQNMTATINSELMGGEGLIKTDLGTLILGGANIYTGGTSIQNGVLQVEEDHNLGDASGGIQINGSVLRTTGGFETGRGITLGSAGGTLETLMNLTAAGVIDGTGPLIKQGAGTLTLAGMNTYSGNTLIQNGRLILDPTASIAGSKSVSLLQSGTALEVNGTQAIQDFSGVAGSSVFLNGSLTFGTANQAVFSGSFSGAGAFTKQGSGELVLNGTSSGFTGDAEIKAGTLKVNGVLGGSLLIGPESRLEGLGSVDNLTVEGVIAPGDPLDKPVGTLTVAGNYVQKTGSLYEVDIQSTQSDLISVKGTASIQGQVNTNGFYKANTRYTLLQALGGVSGTYTMQPLNLPFLTATLAYDPTHVYLDAYRTSLSFSDTAKTINQRNTATGVESLGSGNVIYDMIVNVPSTEEMPFILDSLSGEGHASVLGVLIEESRYIREATLTRLQQVFSPQKSILASFSGAGLLDAARDLKWWGQGYGAWGSMAGNKNAAKINRSNRGFFIGTDRPVGRAVRTGVVGGYSQSSLDLTARNTQGAVANYSLGIYSGFLMDNISVRGGGAYTWQSLKMNRTVQVISFRDKLNSQYDIGTGQIFVETGYQLNSSRLNLEPFAGLAYVSTNAGDWLEQGGAAALKGKGHQDVSYSTLGVHEAARLYEGNKLLWDEQISLGWRHAYNAITPQSAFSFVSGSSAFMIYGAPIAQDALMMDVGVNLHNRPDTWSFKLAYNSQLSSQAQDYAVTGKVSWQFE